MEALAKAEYEAKKNVGLAKQDVLESLRIAEAGMAHDDVYGPAGQGDEYNVEDNEKIVLLGTKEIHKLIAKERVAIFEEYAKWAEHDSDFLKNLRQQRMAMESEIAAMAKILNELRDIRKFFLSPEHQQEVYRIEEFATIVERLVSLKKSGALDTLADTILKLACSK